MGKLRQAHTSITCSIGNILVGLMLTWPSYTLDLYTDKNTTLLSAPMTDIESSLVGSIPSLGAMLGTAVVGWILSTFGRQKTGLVLVTPCLISWLMIAFTSSSTVILIARVIAGASAGASLVYCPIYVSEVAEESIRGALATVPVASYCIGVLISYILGWFLTYRYILWANVTSCVLYAAMLMTVKESPMFLMRQKKEKEARLAIAYYRGASVSSKIVLEEFSRLKQAITPAVELISVNTDIKADECEKAKLNADAQDIEPQQMSPIKMLCVSQSLRRAFIVVGLTMCLQVMMGTVAVLVYAKNVFYQAAPNLSSHFCSVLLALMMLAGSLFSVALSDKFGRRILLTSSSIAVTLILCTMGVFLQTSIAPPWITAVLILAYFFTFMFGAGSVPYVLMAESFIPEVQSTASMLLMECLWLVNFLIVGVFPFIVKYFGIHGSFYTFAAFALADVFVGIFLQPETKGLTTEQVQEAYLGRRKK